MKKYKILIITDYAAPYEGNFIESLKALHKKLKDNANEIVYLFSPKAKDKNCVSGLQKLGYKVYFGSESVKDNIKIIRKAIKQEKITMLYTHFCSLKTQLQVKLVRFFNPKLKLISHFHNHYKYEGRFPRKQLQFISYNGDLNIACSKSVMGSIPYSNKKTVYIDNCINFERLNNYRDVNIEGLDNKFVILMFGFDYYRKGVDIAIKALKRINNPNIVLAISLSKNRKTVEENIIKDFGTIPKFVKFLDPIDDIATYYNKADVFLSASREEGLCYSVIEAAYCKTKIVVSNISGVLTNIPGEFLFESEDYLALSNIIAKIYKGNVEEKKVEAYMFVKDNYSIEKWVSETVSCIEEKL